MVISLKLEASMNTMRQSSKRKSSLPVRLRTLLRTPLRVGRKCEKGRWVYSVFAFICVCLSYSHSANARTYGVVMAGLGGTEDYAVAFNDASLSLSGALRTLESDESLVITLDEKASRNDLLAAISDQTERMKRDAEQLAASGASGKQAVFVLMLVGHGNADANGWRFNVTGPDLTTDDLIAALNTVPASQQLVVLAASASGAALDPLSQLGRVVLTATKSGGEINAVRFPEFFAQAVQSDVADFDRNEILTVAEAYRFADARTRDYFEQQKLLASEHSRLRGDLADEFPIALLGSLKDARDDPVVAQLLDERLVLEQTFKSLRERKNDLPVEQYYVELEELLLSIARLQQSIDETTGWSENDADS